MYKVFYCPTQSSLNIIDNKKPDRLFEILDLEWLLSILIKHVFTVQDNNFGIENVQSTPSPVRNHLNRRIVADIKLKMLRYF